ncbi:hypothetical protein EBU94_02660 [bacterium]|nr:hypothetical protein [bacterium]
MTAQGVSCIIRSWSRKNGGGKVKKKGISLLSLKQAKSGIAPRTWIYSFSSLFIQIALLGAVFVIAYVVLWVAHVTKKRKR